MDFWGDLSTTTIAQFTFAPFVFYFLCACRILEMDPPQPSEFHAGSANITGYLTKYNQNQKFIVYNISLVIAPHLSWNITKRFSEFLQFHRQLPKHLRSSLPKLPAKTLFHKNLSVIEQRKSMFQVYLNALLEREHMMRESVVREFLSVPEDRYYQKEGSNDNASEDETPEHMQSSNRSPSMSMNQRSSSLDQKHASSINSLETSHPHDGQSLEESASRRPTRTWRSTSWQSIDSAPLHNHIQYQDVPCSMSKVMRTHRSEHDSELSVTEQDFVLVYAQDDDWALVRNEEKIGFIPAHALHEDVHACSANTPASAVRRRQSVLSAQQNHEWFVGQPRDNVAFSPAIMSNLTSILYDYYPLHENELHLSRGDLVRIIREQDDRYEVAVVERESASQKEPKSGWIPCDYIEKPRLLRSSLSGYQ
mmetsp:Transcript_5755/g.21776  ORF Transcript_5755/g.21776 Transcript_5755/m.21776 type:complete len:422 (-) Transcript_5755:167-1432(-)